MDATLITNEEEQVIEESLQAEPRLNPTSEKAIALLEKVKLKVNNDKTDNNDETSERCCICLVNFEQDEDVSKMPCHHVYHRDCIIQWLRINHVCPLCRFQMPV